MLQNKQGIEMWFGLALFTLLTYVNAIGNITQLPTGCICQEPSNSSLTVDCRQRLLAVDVKQLTQELDSILSADHMVDHLTSLRITNTPLTHVPSSVCKLVNLTSLYIDLTTFPNCQTTVSPS